MFKHIIIVLDAGHGGHDSGAIGSRSQEKTNALQLVLALGKILEGLGFTVFYTRKTDVYLTLNERARISDRRNATIFISVHNNAATASATGFETFIFNGNVSNNTRQLQTAIHNVIAKSIGIRDRGKKRANFAVLRLPKASALLIEYAFISNVNDENILMNEVDKLADLTAKGICDYFGVEYNTGGLTVKQFNELKKLINAQNEEIALLKKDKLNKPSNSQTPTKDHADSVKVAKQYGITNGSNPRAYATKEQTATMIVNLVNNLIKNNSGPEEYAETPLEWANEKGVSDAKNPAHLASRQQVITMIKRAYDLTTETDTAKEFED